MKRFYYISAITGGSCFALGYFTSCLLTDHDGADIVRDTSPRPAMESRRKDSAEPILPPLSKTQKINYAPGECRRPEISEHALEDLFNRSRRGNIFQKNTVSDELADCLALTTKERTMVDELLGIALQELKAEQRAHARVTRTTSDVTFIKIANFTNSGLVVKERLLSQLSQRLGPERMAVFMSLTGKEMNDTYMDFGQKDVEIEFHGVSKQTNYEIIVNSGSTGRRFETESMPELLEGIIDFKSE
jgi:hypothetical protein